MLRKCVENPEKSYERRMQVQDLKHFDEFCYLLENVLFVDLLEEKTTCSCQVGMKKAICIHSIAVRHLAKVEEIDHCHRAADLGGATAGRPSKRKRKVYFLEQDDMFENERPTRLRGMGRPPLMRRALEFQDDDEVLSEVQNVQIVDKVQNVVPTQFNGLRVLKVEQGSLFRAFALAELGGQEHAEEVKGIVADHLQSNKQALPWRAHDYLDALSYCYNRKIFVLTLGNDISCYCSNNGKRGQKKHLRLLKVDNRYYTLQ